MMSGKAEKETILAREIRDIVTNVFVELSAYYTSGGYYGASAGDYLNDGIDDLESGRDVVIRRDGEEFMSIHVASKLERLALLKEAIDKAVEVINNVDPNNESLATVSEEDIYRV